MAKKTLGKKIINFGASKNILLSSLYSLIIFILAIIVGITMSGWAESSGTAYEGDVLLALFVLPIFVFPFAIGLFIFSAIFNTVLKDSLKKNNLFWLNTLIPIAYLIVLVKYF